MKPSAAKIRKMLKDKINQVMGGVSDAKGAYDATMNLGWQKQMEPSLRAKSRARKMGKKFSFPRVSDYR